MEVTLTGREAQVLELMADGLTNKEIAAKLNVTPETIKSHVRNLLSKYDVATRTALVSVAFRNGVVT